MRETQSIEWTRTMLQQAECDDLLTALTAEQGSHLVARDDVWVEKVGVLWKTVDGGDRAFQLRFRSRASRAGQALVVRVRV